jgi:pyruvate/2-oxoglutarate dehydrogenase complex dihydrolipoamide acyltransferase (E2) component
MTVLNLFKKNKGERIERISMGRLLVSDGFIMRGKQSSYANFAITLHLNLSAAEQFMQNFQKKTGAKPSLTCLMVKASAKALKKYPDVNAMLSGNGTKIIRPSSIDIGVNIAGQEKFTPVVVLRDADKKNLLEIIAWLRSASDEARNNEQKIIASLDAIGWLLPLPPLRRAFLKYFINNHRVRRNMVGTFQISTLHGSNVKHASSATFLTTAFLIVGGVSRMPCEVNGKVEFCPCVEMMLNGDHRMMDGMQAINFGREIIDILENPLRLEES